MTMYLGLGKNSAAFLTDVYLSEFLVFMSNVFSYSFCGIPKVKKT